MGFSSHSFCEETGHTEVGDLLSVYPESGNVPQGDQGTGTRSPMALDTNAVSLPLLPRPPSDSESKTNIVKVIRSILRENFRRHIKSEFPLEKTCKDRLVPLKNRVPVSAKLGENSASLECVHQS